MSAPSTPARSSRVSSAASTPAMRASRSPIELTPRSKVKAILAGAGLSDDSDDEISTKPAAQPVKHTEQSTKSTEPTAKASAPKPTTNIVSSDSEDDDDAPVQRPVGRIAARMLAQAQNNGQDTDEEGGENAYERVKKMLMAGKGKQEASTTEREESLGDAESSSGEELPVRPAATRKIARGIRKPSETPRSATPVSRRSSPGLFMSPSRPSPAKSTADGENAADSDSDIPDPFAKSRLDELVARKRAERKAREEEQKRERQENRRKSKASARKSRREEKQLNGVETDSEDEDDISKKLTQQSRPTRKASKKAIEEMNRETQRMNRNMQLAHQARTKKKYTTKDLFAKFNYGQAKEQEKDTQQSNNTTSSIPVSSEGENLDKETPPSSPPSADEKSQKPTRNNGMDSNEFPGDTVIDIGQEEDSDGELPDLGKVLSQPRKIDKGKGRVGEPVKQTVSNPEVTQPSVPVPLNETRTKAFRVVLPERTVAAHDSDDDDLEIIRDTRFPVFDKIPARKAREPESLLKLRYLAHLTSPSKTRQKGRASMNPAELQDTLQRRAREQAKREKEEKIAELRARGIIVQTEEERETDQLELENLLEKARKEAQELAVKEKEQAKKEGKDVDGDELPDSEDDESYVEEEEDQEQEVDLSGSEDEDENEEEEEEETRTDGDGLLNNEADEDDEELDPEDEDMADARAEDSEREEVSIPIRRSTTVRHRNRVIDDEDEDNEENMSKAILSQFQLQPSTTQDETMAAFGFTDDASLQPQPQPSPDQDETMAAFGFTEAAPAGLSQMFAGTMAEADSQPQGTGPAFDDTQQYSMDYAKDIPLSTIPPYQSTAMDSQDFIIKDSQVAASQAADNGAMDVNIGISQFPSQRGFANTQISDMPDPTQDNSFTMSRTPGRLLRAPTSTFETVDTVVLPEESPVVKKKGRLQRRSEAAVVLSDVDDDQDSAAVADASSDEEFAIAANAFDVMRKGAKKAKKVDAFDKKRSAAKEMVQEQAEESEDEYAGLGGASDEESGGEMDEELKEMIEEGDVRVNEREIAAFYADKERADDEKRINKLYKDINNGGLRRKRGGDFELSDSDDDAAEQRRRKQREFARMRKALLEDENIGKIAENPKKLAFFRALEDHDDNDEMDFLDEPEEDSQSQSISDSQEPAARTETPHLETAAANAPPANPLKRKGTYANENDENRPPAAQRRTKESSFKKPTTIAEIRESVSFLIDEPLVKETQYSDDEDEEDDHAAGPSNAQAARATFTSRRTDRSAIVDRLSLARSTSSNLSEGAPARASNEPMAFHAPATSHVPGFRVPSLLRRVTTNLSATSETGTTTYSNGGSSGGAGAGESVRRGGSKKSNIHYQAREAERKRVVDASEKRRKEGLRKKVSLGGKRSVLGMLGSAGGGFE
ncbi:uncharacterized protein K452DRAFT_321941 [Aplosporella prunicola CBS 121167]|uniref:DNA replication checkpoint mediator MRC1 domain-containing protein n=1 Tax=Aplosporella prunicola CBS 121167 TaxID=1176127 RepID=A0A6A6B3E6_9PEZI|nr:uncharacterized protein K452DRAFT_321941 [Aplosporella prunicola CBS 121167]KAF2137251.1 hypothetical protein K452DRAFT_321941 [Aplosporella prunicola CBS 121167]